jgi:hypothetical protein
MVLTYLHSSLLAGIHHWTHRFRAARTALQTAAHWIAARWTAAERTGQISAETTAAQKLAALMHDDCWEDEPDGGAPVVPLDSNAFVCAGETEACDGLGFAFDASVADALEAGAWADAEESWLVEE